MIEGNGPRVRTDKTLAEWRSAHRELEEAVAEREATEQVAASLEGADRSTRHTIAAAEEAVKAAEQVEESARQSADAVHEAAAAVDAELEEVRTAEEAAAQVEQEARQRHQQAQQQAFDRYPGKARDGAGDDRLADGRGALDPSPGDRAADATTPELPEPHL